MFFGCSKEPSHGDGSFEYPQHMFRGLFLNLEIFFIDFAIDLVQNVLINKSSICHLLSKDRQTDIKTDINGCYVTLRKTF